MDTAMNMQSTDVKSKESLEDIVQKVQAGEDQSFDELVLSLIHI